jgi:site-specific DNA recombinase
MKVIAYCRVSTENQKEEGTVNLQVNAIKEFCDKFGYELVSVFKDEGVSGGLENRPALAEMYSYLETNSPNINAVIIWKLDRLARDLYIQEHLIKKFESLKVRLISTKEADLDSNDPMRKAFRQFMGIVSELEKAFITMRLSGGRIQKAKKGQYAGGRVALGYSSKNNELFTNVPESIIIQMIFKLKRKNHLSINGIAKLLNKQNIPTKNGKIWYPSTVSYILKNQIYRGFYSYNGIKNDRSDLALI